VIDRYDLIFFAIIAADLVALWWVLS